MSMFAQGKAMMAKWRKSRTDAQLAKFEETAKRRFGIRQARKRWKDRGVRVFQSPGRIAEGPARPTAGASGALNTIDFRSGKQLLYTDGSFRQPGRRRIHVVLNGEDVVLGGRRLRNLKKRGRRLQREQEARTRTGTASI